MENNKVTIIGAGFYGCLTAWKIKKNFPELNVDLIDSADHIISSADPIEIGNKLYNNGFHGIELPRAKEIFNFFKNQLKMSFVTKKNIRKLLINGEIVDYTSSLEDYPPNLKKFFLKTPEKFLENFEDFFEYISDDYKEILNKISLRYSDNFEDSYHYLIPWFFPTNFNISASDEGYLFRNAVRLKKIYPEFGFPSTFLFKDIQKPFFDELISLGIKVNLDTNVEINNSGINYFKKTNNNEVVQLSKNQTVFFCNSPVSILKNVSEDSFNDLIKNRRTLINAIIELKDLGNSLEFSEMLCADLNFSKLSRISKVNNLNANENIKFQLEITSKTDDGINEITKEIEKYIPDIFLKYNYKFLGVVGLKASRTLFFPDSKTISSAINKVKSWSQSFPNFNIQEHFGPMNMAKTWNFSEKNISYIKKNITNATR